jgi:hypothetical protein
MMLAKLILQTVFVKEDKNVSGISIEIHVLMIDALTIKTNHNVIHKPNVYGPILLQVVPLTHVHSQRAQLNALRMTCVSGTIRTACVIHALIIKLKEHVKLRKNVCGITNVRQIHAVIMMSHLLVKPRMSVYSIKSQNVNLIFAQSLL